MQGNKKVIDVLNVCLGNELIAINQLFLHSRMYNNWGLCELGGKEYKKSIEDMKHADKLIERVLFLEGIPNLQKLGKLLVGETPQEMLECDMKLVTSTISDLRESIALCEAESDFVSRNLLTDILHAEEAHLDWLETQLDLIDKVGLQNYLQSMMND